MCWGLRATTDVMAASAAAGQGGTVEVEVRWPVSLKMSKGERDSLLREFGDSITRVANGQSGNQRIKVKAKAFIWD